MPEFKQLLENYVLGYESMDSLKDIAFIGLKEGFESPSLIILAGLEKNEAPSIVDYYLQQTLIELNIDLPDPKKWALAYAVKIIEEISAGHTDAFEGTKNIIDHVLHGHDWSFLDDFYGFDGIGFKKVYGLYYSYEDLIDAGIQWQPAKTDKQLIDNLKWELIHELKIWRTKIAGEIINKV